MHPGDVGLLDILLTCLSPWLCEVFVRVGAVAIFFAIGISTLYALAARTGEGFWAESLLDRFEWLLGYPTHKKQVLWVLGLAVCGCVLFVVGIAGQQRLAERQKAAQLQLFSEGLHE